MKFLTSVLAVLIVFITLEQLVSGRGGRGGGGRFSGGRYSSRYRSTRYSSGSRIGGSRYTKYAAAFAAGYVVYGMTRYRTRYYHSRHYSTDPNICTNLDRYVEYDNGTISRTEKLQYFVCPYEKTDSEDDIYCCGPDEQEYCCSYWQSSAKTGAIVGIILAILAFAVAIFFVIRCMKKRNSSRKEFPAASYHVANTSDPYTANSIQVPPAGSGYAPGTGTGYSPYPSSAPYPPAGDQVPYPPADGSAPYPAYPPQGPGSGPNYPPNPTGGPLGFEGVASPPPPSYETVASAPKN